MEKNSKDKDLLRGLYSDLFENVISDVAKNRKDPKKPVTSKRPSPSSEKKKPVPVKKETPVPPEVTPIPVTEEDALKMAEDALQDAKKVFGDLPVQASAEPEKAEKPAEPETDPMEDLDKLIGLTGIKHDVKELMDFVKIQKMRKDAGLKSVPTSLHLVFTGNPGTGKTTVARIIGRLYKQIGVLEKGQLIEVDRSGLVAGYVGQTAIKTQEKIKEAMGGVLFIDEAYALAGGEQDAFGQEAINTILKAMEDNRDNLVIIVAGYTEPMEYFINSNPGLKSRFNKYIEFPDYTIDELEAIFYMNCSKYDYVVEEDVKHQIRTQIVTRKFLNLENFANAREVRNMFEEIITNQARRVASMESPSHDDMMKITLDDLSDPVAAGTTESPAETVPAVPEELPETVTVANDESVTETSAPETPAAETSAPETPAAETPAADEPTLEISSTEEK